MDDLEAFFLHSIPSLFRQAERNLHSDNLNVLDYFERRLDDHAYVIRSVILQCEQQSASEDLIQLLELVHEEVNGLNDQFQDLCNTQRNIASEMGFSCPVEQFTGQGRPRRGNQRITRCSWRLKRSGQRSTCILQNNSTKVTSVFQY